MVTYRRWSRVCIMLVPVTVIFLLLVSQASPRPQRHVDPPPLELDLYHSRFLGEVQQQGWNVATAKVIDNWRKSRQANRSHHDYRSVTLCPTHEVLGIPTSGVSVLTNTTVQVVQLLPVVIQLVSVVRCVHNEDSILRATCKQVFSPVMLYTCKDKNCQDIDADFVYAESGCRLLLEAAYHPYLIFSDVTHSTEKPRVTSPSSVEGPAVISPTYADWDEDIATSTLTTVDYKMKVSNGDSEGSNVANVTKSPDGHRSPSITYSTVTNTTAKSTVHHSKKPDVSESTVSSDNATSAAVDYQRKKTTTVSYNEQTNPQVPIEDWKRPNSTLSAEEDLKQTTAAVTATETATETDYTVEETDAATTADYPTTALPVTIKPFHQLYLPEGSYNPVMSILKSTGDPAQFRSGASRPKKKSMAAVSLFNLVKNS